MGMPASRASRTSAARRSPTSPTKVWSFKYRIICWAPGEARLDVETVMPGLNFVLLFASVPMGAPSVKQSAWVFFSLPGLLGEQYTVMAGRNAHCLVVMAPGR